MTVHHVALEATAADREPLAAFFVLLGFELVDPPDGLRGRTLWLERGGTQVHVLFAEAAVVAPQSHAAVLCTDYEATLERLRAAGFAPEPRTEHWGAPRCFVCAPGGHRIEVMAAPPSS